MITVQDRERIRHAYFIEQKSIRQIAREQHHAPKTIKKAIASSEAESYSLSKPRPAPVLGPYKAEIERLLAENEKMPRKQRYTTHKIYLAIQEQGYPGSEPTVRGYVAKKRKEKRRPKVYLPLEFDPGADAQVDWGGSVCRYCRRTGQGADIRDALELLPAGLRESLSSAKPDGIL